MAPAASKSSSPGVRATAPAPGPPSPPGCGRRRRRRRRSPRTTRTSSSSNGGRPARGTGAATRPRVATGPEHGPQLVVVALGLHEVAVPGAAQRAVVGRRPQRRRRASARGRGRANRFASCSWNSPCQNVLAVALVEALHPGRRHRQQRRGVDAEPHGAVIGNGLAHLDGDAPRTARRPCRRARTARSTASTARGATPTRHASTVRRRGRRRDTPSLGGSRPVGSAERGIVAAERRRGSHA